MKILHPTLTKRAKAWLAAGGVGVILTCAVAYGMAKASLADTLRAHEQVDIETAKRVDAHDADIKTIEYRNSQRDCAIAQILTKVDNTQSDVIEMKADIREIRSILEQRVQYPQPNRPELVNKSWD